MHKTILITGSTDGLGLETAKLLLSPNHHLILHGRRPDKLAAATRTLSALSPTSTVSSQLADLSILSEVQSLATNLISQYPKVDVVINNAGILKTPQVTTPDGLDIRFSVNTLAPYILTHRLLPHLSSTARVVNVSSAAQAPINLNALSGRTPSQGDFEMYAQSKLALMMWTNHVAKSVQPVLFSVNPGSMLASKMVKEGFGVDGRDMSVGATVLKRAALADQFANSAGQYFDNDTGRFASPHPDCLDPSKCEQLVKSVDSILEKHGISVRG
eukprot:GFKZ01009672.1.p1 GENE.GFKZ01009672.1~~GFKZ01009672.1.p1  ORF type:complete len:272 (+),score=33.95 GFKZ01009672.1:87-902(+)